MIVTTTQFTEGQTIREYKGIVVGEAIIGANIARGLAKGMVGRTGMLGQK
jgi:uncharacterized protein YbjQ (UPF0145 family)